MLASPSVSFTSTTGSHNSSKLHNNHTNNVAEFSRFCDGDISRSAVDQKRACQSSVQHRRMTSKCNNGGGLIEGSAIISPASSLESSGALTQPPSRDHQGSADTIDAKFTTHQNSHQQHQQGLYEIAYQDELNRMSERLFRLLSKVPIQVEGDLVSSAPHNECQFTTTSVVDRGARVEKRFTNPTLLIKYYSEKCLNELLELHFSCSLLRHNHDRSLPLKTGSMSRFYAPQPDSNRFNFNVQQIQDYQLQQHHDHNHHHHHHHHHQQQQQQQQSHHHQQQPYSPQSLTTPSSYDQSNNMPDNQLPYQHHQPLGLECGNYPEWAPNQETNAVVQSSSWHEPALTAPRIQNKTNQLVASDIANRHKLQQVGNSKGSSDFTLNHQLASDSSLPMPGSSLNVDRKALDELSTGGQFNSPKQMLYDITRNQLDSSYSHPTQSFVSNLRNDADNYPNYQTGRLPVVINPDRSMECRLHQQTSIFTSGSNVDLQINGQNYNQNHQRNQHGQSDSSSSLAGSLGHQFYQQDPTPPFYNHNNWSGVQMTQVDQIHTSTATQMIEQQPHQQQQQQHHVYLSGPGCELGQNYNSHQVVYSIATSDVLHSAQQPTC